MKNVSMNMPKTSVKDVWIGSYGGHYTAVVIFHTKPTKTKGEGRLQCQARTFVDLLDNKNNIAACMWECDFKDLYPTANIPPPKATDVTTLYKRTIEAFWTEDNRIEFPHFNCDGW